MLWALLSTSVSAYSFAHKAYVNLHTVARYATGKAFLMHYLEYLDSCLNFSTDTQSEGRNTSAFALVFQIEIKRRLVTPAQPYMLHCRWPHRPHCT